MAAKLFVQQRPKSKRMLGLNLDYFAVEKLWWNWS